MEHLFSPQKGHMSITQDREREQALSDSSLQYLFFIFINPTSGSNKAQGFMKLEVEKMIFSTLNGVDVNVEVNFYNMLDTTSREKGLVSLRNRQEERTDIRIIVGGGDGTVMWVVEEMIKHDINFNKCPIATLPFGTGNDLSRVLGWGGAEPDTLVGPYLKGLKELVKGWIEGMVEDFDIWDVTFDCYEEGGIRKIFKESGKKFERRFLVEKDLETGKEQKVRKFNKKMCNYYSFGVDARIGYGFDKFRTSSRVVNKTIYCWEGFKKMFIKTFRVNHLLDKAHDYFDKDSTSPLPVEENKGEENQNNEQNIDKIEYIGKEFLLYPSNSKYDRPKHATIIKGDPSVFLCLNIPSYMGGRTNPWAASKGKVGATDHLNKTLQDFQDQKFGDGKLEILSFSGPITLAMESFLCGQGRRVGQSKGPFHLNFKRNVDAANPFCTYMQVDGEYYELIAPKSVKISLARDIPHGKIKVLVNRSHPKR